MVQPRPTLRRARKHELLKSSVTSLARLQRPQQGPSRQWFPLGGHQGCRALTEASGKAPPRAIRRFASVELHSSVTPPADIRHDNQVAARAPMLSTEIAFGFWIKSHFGRVAIAHARPDGARRRAEDRNEMSLGGVPVARRGHFGALTSTPCHFAFSRYVTAEPRSPRSRT
jgi:hypothetical protein